MRDNKYYKQQMLSLDVVAWQRKLGTDPKAERMIHKLTLKELGLKEPTPFLLKHINEVIEMGPRHIIKYSISQDIWQQFTKRQRKKILDRCYELDVIFTLLQE